MTTYRTLLHGEIIPENAEYYSQLTADWKPTGEPGSVYEIHENNLRYRVPIDDEPPPPTDERVAVIGDTRYMEEEGQWYRLLDIGELIPPNAEFLNGSERWWRTERVGERVEDPRVEYRVPCDPPMRATPPPCEYERLIKERDQLLVRYQRLIKERDRLLVRYQSLKAEYLKALEVIENIRDALTAKDA